MSEKERLKELVHRAGMGERDQLFVLVGADNNRPKSTGEIKDLAASVGLRKVGDISTRLSKAKNFVIRTNEGWELNMAGKERLQSVTGADVPVGTTGRDATGSTGSFTRCILFLDIAGWSSLTPERIINYVERAMPRLAEFLDSAVMVNTWGDAIVAVFESARNAAETALRIRDAFHQGNPLDGFATGLSCRISLHVGEVLFLENPILKRRDIFGDAVHVAARLEPMADRGSVFCTDQFANALSSLRGVGPSTHARGTVALPKGAGTIAVHLVTWPNESSPAPGTNSKRRSSTR